MVNKKIIVIIVVLLVAPVFYVSITKDRNVVLSNVAPKKPVAAPNTERNGVEYPRGVSKIFPSDLKENPGVSGWIGFLKERKIQVAIFDANSLDLPQVEFLFYILKDDKTIPVQALGLGMVSPPDAPDRYHLNVDFLDTRGAYGLRLGVARDSEEAKLPKLLQMGRSYRVIVQYPTTSQLTSKQITIPTDLKTGAVYQMPIVLDHSRLESDQNMKKRVMIKGKMPLPLPARNDWQCEARYQQPDANTFYSKLGEAGEFEIQANELHGALAVRFFNKKGGYTLALSRQVDRPVMSLENFDWRLDRSKLRDHDWHFDAPVDGIRSLFLKLRKDDHHHVAWTAIPKTSSGKQVKSRFECVPGKYFVSGLIGHDGKRVIVDLGTVIIGDNGVSSNLLPRNQIIEQRNKLIKQKNFPENPKKSPEGESTKGESTRVLRRLITSPRGRATLAGSPRSPSADIG